MKLQFKKLDPKAIVPQFKSDGASGMDLYALKPMVIAPKNNRLIQTGIAMAVPPGFEGQVRSRSGMAFKHNVFVLNAPGTIDADYRGEVGVILYNGGAKDYQVREGDRIAQLAISPVGSPASVDVETTEDLPATQRGDGGFGSTGR